MAYNATQAHLIPEQTSQVTYHKMQKYLSKFPIWVIHGEEYNVMFIHKFFSFFLSSLAWVSKLIIFLVPTKDLIVSPFKGRGQHVCLTDHLWYWHMTPLLDEGHNQEDVQCSHQCDKGEEAQLEGEHSQTLEQVLFPHKRN